MILFIMQVLTTAFLVFAAIAFFHISWTGRKDRATFIGNMTATVFMLSAIMFMWR